MKYSKLALGLMILNTMGFAAASGSNLRKIDCRYGAQGPDSITLAENGSTYTFEIRQSGAGGVVSELMPGDDEDHVYSAAVTFPKQVIRKGRQTQTCFFAPDKPRLVFCDLYGIPNTVVIKNTETGHLIHTSPISLEFLTTTLVRKESALNPTLNDQNIESEDPILPNVPETPLRVEETLVFEPIFIGKDLPDLQSLKDTVEYQPSYCTAQ